MSTEINSAAQTAQPILFDVTLPWNPSNSQEGDYRDTVWATSPEAAVLALASEMAEHPDSGTQTIAERDEFIKKLVDDANDNGIDNAAEPVADRLLSDCRSLIGGPKGAHDEQAKADIATIAAILERYGAGK